MRVRTICAILIMWCVAVLVLAAVTNAATVSFSWLPNSETDLAGYKLYYGPMSRQYDTTVDTGLPDVVDGRIHYTILDVPVSNTFFAVTAYDTSGRESDYSTELSFDPPPAVVEDFSIITTTTTTTTTTIVK